jgi:uncharacterized protein (DUF1778 family)
MSSRLPKTSGMARIHSHMLPKWAKEITKAAKNAGMSRSNYIANAAYAKALRDNSEAAAK